MYLNAEIHNPILLYLQAMEDLEIPSLLVLLHIILLGRPVISVTITERNDGKCSCRASTSYQYLLLFPWKQNYVMHHHISRKVVKDQPLSLGELHGFGES